MVPHSEMTGRFAFMKDPAFLFYSSDFLSGTMTMTHEQVGKYIRLLCLQHQKGELSEKDMLFICGTYDEDIWNKFSRTETGTFLNVRLKEEVLRRKAYSESRRSNRMKKTSKTYVRHMETETETIIESKKKGGAGGKKQPTQDEVIQFFNDKGYSSDAAMRAFDYYNAGGWRDRDGKEVKNWKQKMIAVWFKEDNKLKPHSTQYAKLT
jgi:uncharacterized protein YdaU (DUF1376 family)